MALKNEKTGDIIMEAQKSNNRWTREEINFLEESIIKGKTLEEITSVITLRTHEAIIAKAKILGYGYYLSKNDRLTYFKRKKDTKSITKIQVNADDFDRMIALYQEIVAHYQKTLAQLEKTKSRLWEH